MIKKIIFKNLSTSLNYLAIGGIRFYDEDGLVIPSGKFQYQNGNDSITENFITNTSMPAYSVNYRSYKAFDTDIQPTSGCFNSSGKITNGQLSCTFKTPIKTIYKIDFMANYFREVRAGVTEPFSIEIIDENDKVIQSYSATPVLTTYVTQTILTPELNLSQKYLIKSQNKINILSEDKTTLIYPNIQTPLSQEDYETWGMNTLDGYENEINKVSIEMKNEGILEDGFLFRKTINKNEFKIKDLKVGEMGG